MSDWEELKHPRDKGGEFGHSNVAPTHPTWVKDVNSRMPKSPVSVATAKSKQHERFGSPVSRDGALVGYMKKVVDASHLPGVGNLSGGMKKRTTFTIYDANGKKLGQRYNSYDAKKALDELL